MKTLLFTLEYPPFYGGVANYYGGLVKHWPEPRDILVLDNNGSKLINDKLPFLKWLPAVWRLWRVVKKEKIGHILVGHVLPLGTVVYIVLFCIKMPYSVILHGMDLTLALKSVRKRWLVKKILGGAQNIICGNSYTAEMARQVTSEMEKKKVAVVNPGVENRITHNAQLITLIKKKYNLDNKIVLLSVGRLVKRKGFDKVIESLPEVLKEAPNPPAGRAGLVYAIVGNGAEENNLKFKIKNLKLKNNVLIFNNANNNERDAWLDVCDIFIMPARDIAGDFEGFGIVYLEANLAGKPVIAGDSGGVRDAVADGINGILVNPESVEEIAAAIVKLAKDENLRKKLGEQGRERAVKEFNWEGQTRKIYELLISNS
ncbi:glycosyltransferase family 4 protein [Candidatus Falkowbacteria bacterium]|nr:glycosyltransferase family 4 protein [Candidatus Falkowbacteria bacterium]